MENDQILFCMSQDFKIPLNLNKIEIIFLKKKMIQIWHSKQICQLCQLKYFPDNLKFWIHLMFRLSFEPITHDVEHFLLKADNDTWLTIVT